MYRNRLPEQALSFLLFLLYPKKHNFRHGEFARINGDFVFGSLRNIAVFSPLFLASAIAQDPIDPSADAQTSAASAANASASNLAAPAPDRLNYYWTRTFSWQVLSEALVASSVHQLFGQLIGTNEFGKGFDAYAERYASGFGRRLIANSAEYGMSSVLHEDTRYRPSGLKGFLPRAKYAATHAFLAWSADGQIEPAYGRFAGIAGTALIEPAWHPHSYTGGAVGKYIGLRSTDLLSNSFLTEFGPELKRLRQKILGP